MHFCGFILEGLLRALCDALVLFGILVWKTWLLASTVRVGSVAGVLMNWLPFLERLPEELIPPPQSLSVLLLLCCSQP